MKLLKHILLLGLFILIFHVLTTLVSAYEYPIYELGACRDQRECHLYCEIPQYKAACWSWSVYGNQSRVLGDETPEAAATELGITFPIAALGNCTNVSACKAFCTITQNQTACRAFAQTHNLRVKNKLVEKAKQELGCTSQEECKAFCSEIVNQETCKAFAKKYHLRGEIKDKLVEAAQQELGCSDKESCRQICALPENHDKCAALSRRFNPAGETRKEELIQKAKEQLGCTSFADCKTFCQNEVNRDKCRNFGQAVSGRLQEAGNCTTAEECRMFCNQHPDKCPNFPKLPPRQEGTSSGERPFRPDNRGPGSRSSGPGNFERSRISPRPTFEDDEDEDDSESDSSSANGSSTAGTSPTSGSNSGPGSGF